jgi:hypothetical protein
MPEVPTLEVAKPPSLFHRFTIDYRAFFKAVGKAVIKGVSGHWLRMQKRPYFAR